MVYVGHLAWQRDERFPHSAPATLRAALRVTPRDLVDQYGIRNEPVRLLTAYIERRSYDMDYGASFAGGQVESHAVLRLNRLRRLGRESAQHARHDRFPGARKARVGPRSWLHMVVHPAR